MRELRYTLVGDGPSDICLLRHLSWLVEQYVSEEVLVHSTWADLTYFPENPRGLAERIQVALEYYPCDLLFVHRDAERESPQQRYDEVAEAITAVPAWVAVVPVRMTEAWLLINEQAIRAAAGNPRGTEDLPLPPIASLEDQSDPKLSLYECLRRASGLSGRRLRKFRVAQAACRVADYIQDFSPCRRAAAFVRLEHDIRSVLGEHGWTRSR